MHEKCREGAKEIIKMIIQLKLTCFIGILREFITYVTPDWD